MTWLNNPPSDDSTQDEPAPSVEANDLSTPQLTLHAVRALGIFFIRGAVASLVGAGIAGFGYVILLAGGSSGDAGTVIFGIVVVGIGAVVTLIWEVFVVIAASSELRKSGVA